MKTITVMRDGRPATQEELEAAVRGDPLPPIRVNPLVRLWDSRSDTLNRCAEVVTTNKPLKDQLEAMASAYRQCAREFETPPAALFVELGFEKPNAAGRGAAKPYPAPACSERLIPFRSDAKCDEDGNCTVCGCLWDDAERYGSLQHVCPEGFRSFVIPNSVLDVTSAVGTTPASRAGTGAAGRERGVG